MLVKAMNQHAVGRMHAPRGGAPGSSEEVAIVTAVMIGEPIEKMAPANKPTPDRLRCRRRDRWVKEERWGWMVIGS